jgi:hypothetical protein
LTLFVKKVENQINCFGTAIVKPDAHATKLAHLEAQINKAHKMIEASGEFDEDFLTTLNVGLQGLL